MTDITRKLELIANLKPGEILPNEICNGNQWDWGTLISGICSEALAEIKMLRSYRTASIKAFASANWITLHDPQWKPFYPNPILPPATLNQIEWSVANDPAVWDLNSTSLRPPTSEPKPDPWGSAFAMNTENWK